MKKVMKKEKEKYEDENFVHWLAMYNVHQNDWTKDSIEGQISLYQIMEGDDQFKELQEEIKQIVGNGDLHLFLDGRNKKIKLSDLKFMAEIIVSTK